MSKITALILLPVIDLDRRCTSHTALMDHQALGVGEAKERVQLQLQPRKASRRKSL